MMTNSFGEVAKRLNAAGCNPAGLSALGGSNPPLATTTLDDFLDTLTAAERFEAFLDAVIDEANQPDWGKPEIGKVCSEFALPF